MDTLARFLLACAAVLAMAGPANATLYDFTLTGDYEAHFQIDSSPVVTVLDPDAFAVLNVTGTFAGVVGSRKVSFYTPKYYGGMAISQTDAFPGEMSVFGEQVFAGPIGTPTFLLGRYDFTGFIGLEDGYVMQLTIAAVPELDSWLLMIAGIGVLAAVTRTRKPAAG
jgi:hypothetical protein